MHLMHVTHKLPTFKQAATESEETQTPPDEGTASVHTVVQIEEPVQADTEDKTTSSVVEAIAEATSEPSDKEQEGSGERGDKKALTVPELAKVSWNYEAFFRVLFKNCLSVWLHNA